MEAQNRSDEPPRSFGNLHAQQRLAPFTKLGTLRNETQPVEVHVCTADYSDEPLSRPDEVVVDDVTLQACQADSAGWLGYGPGFYQGKSRASTGACLMRGSGS